MRRVVLAPSAHSSVWIVSQDCGSVNIHEHLAITDTPITRAAAKSPAKINYRRLTELNPRYYGHSLLTTLTRGPEGVRNKRS